MRFMVIKYPEKMYYGYSSTTDLNNDNNKKDFLSI